MHSFVVHGMGVLGIFDDVGSSISADTLLIFRVLEGGSVKGRHFFYTCAFHISNSFLIVSRREGVAMCQLYC